MQKIGFAEALDSIVASDPRYHRDAYVFLRDALDFTTKQQKKIKGTTVRHVAGPELLDGVRQYALKEFGPLVITVFDNWGIHCCEDIGHMVRRFQKRLRFPGRVRETVRAGKSHCTKISAKFARAEVLMIGVAPLLRWNQ